MKAQSALADAILAGASADVTHNYTIEISHALMRQFTLGASAGYATDHYIGASLTDSTTTLALKAEYHLSRDVVLKASAVAAAVRLQRAEFELRQRRVPVGRARAAVSA